MSGKDSESPPLESYGRLITVQEQIDSSCEYESISQSKQYNQLLEYSLFTVETSSEYIGVTNRDAVLNGNIPLPLSYSKHPQNIRHVSWSRDSNPIKLVKNIIANEETPTDHDSAVRVLHNHLNLLVHHKPDFAGQHASHSHKCNVFNNSKVIFAEKNAHSVENQPIFCLDYRDKKTHDKAKQLIKHQQISTKQQFDLQFVKNESSEASTNWFNRSEEKMLANRDYFYQSVTSNSERLVKSTHSALNSIPNLVVSQSNNLLWSTTKKLLPEIPCELQCVSPNKVICYA